MRRLTTFAFALGLASPLWAGTPTVEPVTCPVGGETFEITGTLSCSTMGRYMSFRPVTSCDFVTLLPVCPGNGLPLYRDFAPDEVGRIEAFMGTPDYAALIQEPPFQRAYGLASHMGEAGTAESFWLLMNAFWYETPALLSNPGRTDAFFAEMGQELDRADPDERVFLQAIGAYALALSGDEDRARAEVELLRSHDLPEVLSSYVARVEACISDMTAEICLPEALFQP